MNEFIDRLPVRVAALAGLVVGAVSLSSGSSPMGSLKRVVVAMIVFAVVGIILRALVQQSALESTLGSRIDTTTPEMSMDELNFGGHGFGGDQGDFSER